MRTEPSFSAEPEDRFAGAGVVASSTDSFAEADSQLLAGYRQRYGLSVDPFVDDPHFPFYSGAQRRQILDQLLHLCQFSHNLLVVVGDYGVGKTRMAQALIDALDDADDICFLEGQINSSYDSLVADMLEQFELSDEAAFVEFSARQTDQDGLLVVIIDNAHHLTDAVVLELINQLRASPEVRIHLVLFAEPHLLDRLEEFNVPDVILSDFFLEKFSLGEAVDYLNFRMEMADYLGPEIFSESRVESWWRQAQGQLLVLHELAQEKLLESVSTPSKRAAALAGRSLPLPHIIAASVLGAGLLMGYLYLNGPSSDSPEQLVNPIPVSKMTSVSSAPVLSAISSQAHSSAPAPVANQMSVSVVGASASVAPKIDQPAVVSSLAVSSEPAEVKQSVVPLVHTNSVKADAVPGSKSASVASSKKAAEVNVVKPAVIEATTSKNTAGGGFSDQEKTILSWSGEDYTLQLVGLSSEKSARDFIASQTNKKDLLLFKSKRQGKDWFVVVTGRYPSSVKARQAAQLLPDEQKKASPWPREVKIIQGEIKQR